ncbi:hypothetical protein EJ04DRAFT_500152 [Polyplosphaeria fusca]|uniref:1-alkyl-2-acetylglycerophosphocholine esterase n=1 Tax=Polyplosphaeria fusca TaxID=682080 RepID=A0A9P4QQ52_9PLEO|nr:hypothetical protein EJ04DRAFT_500152 [Polyplosphaeria fusca]
MRLLYAYLVAAFTLSDAFTIPPPTGPYGVGVKPHAFSHTTTNDPVAIGNVSTEILLTFYYPTTEKPEPRPYLYRALASYLESVIFSFPRGTLANITARLAPEAPFLSDPPLTKLPTLIFGPGLNGPPTQIHNALLADLASHGYTIVALDHPYEQPYLDFPDGTGVFSRIEGVPLEPPLILPMHAVRITDSIATLDALPTLSRTLGASFNTTHYVLLGFSVGGSVSFDTAVLEKNRTSRTILGAINLDGTPFGLAGSENSSAIDIHVPSLFLKSSTHPHDDAVNWESWQSGWVKEIRMPGTNHTDFSDYVLWKQWLGWSTPGNGVVEAKRMVEFVRGFVGAFVGFVVDGKEGVLSGDEGVRREWPEVEWLYNGTGKP